MKSGTLILLLIVATSCADSFLSGLSDSVLSYTPDFFFANRSDNLQPAIGSDLNLKMMMVGDGSPTGKCYCSCSLNNQPVFMEIDPRTLPDSDMMTI